MLITSINFNEEKYSYDIQLNVTLHLWTFLNAVEMKNTISFGRSKIQRTWFRSSPAQSFSWDRFPGSRSFRADPSSLVWWRHSSLRRGVSVSAIKQYVIIFVVRNTLLAHKNAFKHLLNDISLQTRKFFKSWHRHRWGVVEFYSCQLFNPWP